MNTPAKAKLLKTLFRVRGQFSERQLADFAGVGTMTVNRLMKKFHEANLVLPQHIGNATIWRLNRSSLFYRPLARALKALEAFPNPLEHFKRTVLTEIPKPGITRMILFGSLAKGKDRAGSDIDLYIETKDEATKRRLRERLEKLKKLCEGRYGKRLSPYLLSRSERRRPKNPALLRNIESGIVLYTRKTASRE